MIAAKQSMPTGPPGIKGDGAGGEAISIMHGTYAWDDAAGSPAVLHDITLSVPKGALCIVVGAVGSGKSSLLAALMHEMNVVSGSNAVGGTVAFAAQVRAPPCPFLHQAWPVPSLAQSDCSADPQLNQYIGL